LQMAERTPALVLLLVLLLITSIALLHLHPPKRTPRVAVCFLTTKPDPLWLQFVDELALGGGGGDYDVDVFVVADTPETVVLPVASPVRGVIQYNDSALEATGFTHMNFYVSRFVKHGRSNVSAWDKAVYAFARGEHRGRYDFVWMAEDDVFVPSAAALDSLTAAALQGPWDLVTPPHHVNDREHTGTWPNWGDLLEHRVRRPWRGGMACCVGMSPRYLDLLGRVVDQFGRLLFLEAMLFTVAHHNRDTIRHWEAPQLASIVYDYDWSLDHVAARPLNLYHPIKSVQRQHSLRMALRAMPPASLSNVTVPFFPLARVT